MRKVIEEATPATPAEFWWHQMSWSPHINNII
jgi:hypothetical protein